MMTTTMMRLFLIALATVQVSAFMAQQQQASLMLRTAMSAEAESLGSSAAEFATKWEVDDSYTATASGLKFKDLSVGEGDSPEDGDTISIHYKFAFDDFSFSDDGMEYFNSQGPSNPNNEPMSFQLGEKMQILKGWAEGMRSMKEGGKRIMIIPPDLGYGDDGVGAVRGFPAIPGKAHLRFEVEMVKVDNSFLTKVRRGIPKPSSIFDGENWLDFSNKK